MKLLIKDQPTLSKSVAIFLKYSPEGVYLCAENKAGTCWYLMDLTKKGIRLIGSVDPELGFSLDSSGCLPITRN